MTKKADIYRLATFANSPLRGNPVHVLCPREPWPLADLQAVAAELNESILAVLSCQLEEAELSFVTPRGPHPGAGHAAHAAAWVALQRRWPGRKDIDFRLPDGNRRRAAKIDGRIGVEWPEMPGLPAEQHDAFLATLGVMPRETLEAPFGWVGVYDSPADLGRLAPDFAALSGLACNTVIVTAPGEGADMTIRVFAPKLGLPEDPVCGTAHRILAPYWGQRLGKTDIVSHQLSPRGGVLLCSWQAGTVRIAGDAALFMEGVLEF